MCVKQTPGCGIAEGTMPPETFNALVPAFTNLEALILNGIGEPLLNPYLENFIRIARSQMPAESWIGFQTNGLLMTDLRAVSLIEAGADRICVSVDANSPEMFEALREGGTVADVSSALTALNHAKNVCKRPEVALGIEYVLMSSNLRELPATLSWAAEHGVTFAIVTHALPYQEQYTCNSAYSQCTREALDFFKKYSEIASSLGFSMTDYLPVRWKFAKNDAEQRLADFFEGMKAEAAKQDIIIDFKKMFQADMNQLEDLNEVFEEAGDVAKRYGISIKLPKVCLSEQRRCDFVEDGGIFIAQDGTVSPCYFLWHNYNCFSSGWNQKVKQLVFGNINRDDILSVWNSSEYLKFRKQVIGYDFPKCICCSLAPCDYVLAEPFEQDCHISDVPCGACLWCMGIFQCLQ